MNVSGTRTRGLLMARSQGQAREEGGLGLGRVRCSLWPELAHVERFDRSVETLEDEFAHCLQLRQRFDLCVYLCIDQNLAIKRLITGSGGEIRDGSGRRILETTLKSDAAERFMSPG